MQTRRILAPLGVTLSTALLASGCGGSSSPQVASLAGGTTTGATPTTDGAVSGPPAGIGGRVVMKLGGGLAFSRCMRAHGVPGFPDPNAQGEIQIAGSAIDPRSASFQAAMRACASNAPHGTPSPAQLAQARRQALAYSACMRRHGLPDFPDPVFSGNSISIRLRAGSGSDLDPGSSTFQAAQRACRSFALK